MHNYPTWINFMVLHLKGFPSKDWTCCIRQASTPAASATFRAWRFIPRHTFWRFRYVAGSYFCCDLLMARILNGEHRLYCLLSSPKFRPKPLQTSCLCEQLLQILLFFYSTYLEASCAWTVGTGDLVICILQRIELEGSNLIQNVLWHIHSLQWVHHMHSWSPF